MVREVVIYIEGDTKRKGKSNAITLRQGFREFFKDLAGEIKIPIELKLVGAREFTIKVFLAEQEYNSDSFTVLLVDSEGRLDENETPKTFLQKISDKFDFKNVKDEQCHLMVQLMESWFVADKEKLAEFYDKDFNAKALPKNKNIEQIPKNDVITGLEKATQKTKKGKYGKGAHSGEILRIIDSGKVRKSAPHCERLFETISNVDK
ncbi:MAG: DUF4276 family protein [Pyrinomonadaceae bacterium]|nr:DUF4276 family protein [Pyrinomonadaceae bacterium]